MPINFEQAIVKFNALALRLRIMLTMASVVLVFMLFDLFWFSGNNQSIKKIEQQTVATLKQSNELIAMQQQQNQNVFKKRNNPKSLKLSSLNDQLVSVRNELTNKTVNLVQPEDMANVLKNIINSTNSLQLQILSKQETVELSNQLKPEENKKESNDSRQVKLFRHSMEIVLKGNFSSTHEFLDRLEKMDKKVAFDSFEYTVDQYPTAKVKLTVSTLSLQKGWIGG